MYQQQNQNQPQQSQQPQMNLQNVQAANAQASNENASELAQSSGQVSQLLLAKARQGFEFGTLNQLAGQNQGMAMNNQTLGNQANQENQSELATSQGQMSQILKNQSN